MWQLFQFPLCPFSRKVRLMLGEKGVGYELVRESPWLRRDEFLDLNPAGQTPVIVQGQTALADSNAICEYFEETIDKAPMIAGAAPARAEIRRLVAWFDEKLYGEVVRPLMEERMLKRLVHRTSPDAKMIRDAMKQANAHLDYIDWLLDHRRWLGGPVLSLADLAALVARHRRDAAPGPTQPTNLPDEPIARLAARQGLSREAFTRRFSRASGMPPHAFRLAARLDEARRLLRAGAPVADVAAELGFADQSHLGRNFKRAFGISPGRYRLG